jgi:hypothetical protein
MRKSILASLVLIILPLAAKSADDDYSLRSCEDSHIQVTGSDVCQRKLAPIPEMSPASRLVFNVYEKASGQTFSATLQRCADPRGYVFINSRVKPADMLKMSGELPSVVEWSPAPRPGNDMIIDFKTAGAQCFGFVRNGPGYGMGYRYVIYGYFCEPRRGTPLSDEEVATDLAKVKVDVVW